MPQNTPASAGKALWTAFRAGFPTSARDFVVQCDPERVAAIGAVNTAIPVDLSDHDVDALVAFLQALTDPAALDLRRDVPASVPSGLPVRD